jgi:hypothetical protein
VLVCTNGRRDACCALRGRALAAALEAAHGAMTWECTHLGGHRFAANLVCLPAGIVYGRVTPSDGPRLVDALLAGRLDAGHLRGRSSWPVPAQVAEGAVRAATGLSGLDDLRLERVDVDGDAAAVEVTSTDGARHRVELAAARLAPPRAISCRSPEELEEPMHWRVERHVSEPSGV